MKVASPFTSICCTELGPALACFLMALGNQSNRSKKNKSPSDGRWASTLKKK